MMWSRVLRYVALTCRGEGSHSKFFFNRYHSRILHEDQRRIACSYVPGLARARRIVNDTTCGHRHIGAQAVRRFGRMRNDLHRSTPDTKNLFTWQRHQWRRYQTYGGWQRNSMWDPQNVAYGIMAANAGVFLMWQSPGYQMFAHKHFVTSYAHLKAGELHTLVTHALSHQQFYHLFANMLTFFFFAPQLGSIIGGARLVQLYAAAAATGGMAHILHDRWHPCLGASSAVNAIVIMTSMISPHSTYLIYGIIPIKAWAAALLWLGFDLYGAVEGRGKTSYVGHLGGAMTGALGFVLLRRRLW